MTTEPETRDIDFRAHAKSLVKSAAELQQQILIKHTAAVLEEMHDQLKARDQEIERLRELANLTVGASVMSASDALLAKFYGVSSLSELVQAQARHVEKLQEKLAPDLMRPTTRPREG